MIKWSNSAGFIIFHGAIILWHLSCRRLAECGNPSCNLLQGLAPSTWGLLAAPANSVWRVIPFPDYGARVEQGPRSTSSDLTMSGDLLPGWLKNPPATAINHRPEGLALTRHWDSKPGIWAKGRGACDARSTWGVFGEDTATGIPFQPITAVTRAQQRQTISTRHEQLNLWQACESNDDKMDLNSSKALHGMRKWQTHEGGDCVNVFQTWHWEAPIWSRRISSPLGPWALNPLKCFTGKWHKPVLRL